MSKSEKFDVRLCLIILAISAVLGVAGIFMSGGSIVSSGTGSISLIMILVTFAFIMYLVCGGPCFGCMKDSGTGTGFEVR
ncbi:MAG: hypothetical protein RTU92_06465 [Candidatus Thorarchaeota archaeon]